MSPPGRFKIDRANNNDSILNASMESMTETGTAVARVGKGIDTAQTVSKVLSEYDVDLTKNGDAPHVVLERTHEVSREPSREGKGHEGRPAAKTAAMDPLN